MARRNGRLQKLKLLAARETLPTHVANIVLYFADEEGPKKQKAQKRKRLTASLAWAFGINLILSEDGSGLQLKLHTVYLL